MHVRTGNVDIAHILCIEHKGHRLILVVSTGSLSNSAPLAEWSNYSLLTLCVVTKAKEKQEIEGVGVVQHFR